MTPENLFSRVFESTLRHPLLTLSVMALVTLVSILGLPKLMIDTGFQSLIPEYDKNKQVYQRVSQEFGSDKKNLVYVGDENLWQRNKLLRIEKLHHDLEKLHFVQRVESLASLRTIRGNGDAIKTIDLMPKVPDSAVDIQEIKQQALYNLSLIHI